ncbi:MAG: sigma-70 family RNA polymerase sigma factor [Bacteroidales bacterium]
MADTLEEILRGCKKGHAESQEALYRRFAPAMYGLCLQYASGEEDAQDILQDGFVKVYQKLGQVRNPAAFPGWIRRVMINTALERYRSQVVLDRVDENREADREVEDGGAYEDLTCQELVALIQELSPKYRMVFNLYALEGYNHAEIAEALGISEGTSKSNLSRARSILQKRVKNLYGSAMIR